MTNFEKQVIDLKAAIEIQENSVVSKTLTANTSSSLTLFAFDKNQSIATHTAPVNAVVQAVEGEVEITISDEKFILKEGEIILMPEGEPHSLLALTPFKMALFKV